MTVYQVLMYCDAPVAERGKMKMSPEQYKYWFGDLPYRTRMSAANG